MKHWTAELVVDARAELGEGPLWDARTGELLWVDIMCGVVHRFDPASGADRPFETGQSVGAVAPRAAGGYVLAVRDGFALADDGGTVGLLAEVEADRPETRMNDGACDSRGRFWAGTMHLDCTTCAGSLYRLDPGGVVTAMLTDVTISNGIGWSLDDRVMYFVDTVTAGIDAFDFDSETGAIEGRRRLATVEEGAGTPDGLVVDADGCLWVALWDGWAVRRYAPDGTHLGTVDVPAARVTKPAFGGEALADLYITTAAADGPDPEQPHAGGIYRTRPGVSGRPTNAFAG
ncbi:MAG: SMP-30/gluconolactonase/LRE family protein [Actinomycetota bacterium]|nr:SMP-30/gluconolactonase/LRE family protein [Actinomycetota bacterium]